MLKLRKKEIAMSQSSRALYIIVMACLSRWSHCTITLKLNTSSINPQIFISGKSFWAFVCNEQTFSKPWDKTVYHKREKLWNLGWIYEHTSHPQHHSKSCRATLIKNTFLAHYTKPKNQRGSCKGNYRLSLTWRNRAARKETCLRNTQQRQHSSRELSCTLKQIKYNHHNNQSITLTLTKKRRRWRDIERPTNDIRYIKVNRQLFRSRSLLLSHHKLLTGKINFSQNTQSLPNSTIHLQRPKEQKKKSLFS